MTTQTSSPYFSNFTLQSTFSRFLIFERKRLPSSFPFRLPSLLRLKNVKNPEPQVARPLQQFPPSYWGDCFLTYTHDSMKLDDYTKQVGALKEEVRKMLIDDSITLSQKMNLINEVQRLGVGYHFEMEIEEGLQQLYSNVHQFDDLYTVSLHFRLLRQHGYNASCDIFRKFKDDNGGFSSSLIIDVPGMLCLYEATHLRTHGEDILDEALAFTTYHLESILAAHPLKREVEYALIQPYHKGLPRLETKHYISFYEEHEERNQTVLKLAKLDLYMLRSLYLKELSDVTAWWKNLSSKLPFVRDRLTESYFWMVGIYFEPQYSVARIITTKISSFISIIDDIYDVFGTVEELQLFTDAIMSWDVSAADGLPDYMKHTYCSLLDLYDEIEEDCTKDGRSYCVLYAKEAMIDVAKAYFTEAKWCNQRYVPTVEEYLSVASVSGATSLIIISAFVGMGDNVPKAAFDWVKNAPQILKAAEIICRVTDDIKSHKFEQERLHVASAVECYMKEYGVLEPEACHELHKVIEKGWKDINQGILSPTAPPIHILVRILNFLRTLNVIYKNTSGYTHAHIELKEHIRLLLIDPINI